jgi:hypothetical protein
MFNKWKIELPLNYKITDDYYLINDIKYWRVTRVKSVINNEGLNRWRSKIGDKEADKIMKERQEIGTKTHKAFELLLNSSYVDMDLYNDEIQKNICLMNEMRECCNLIPDSLEQKLWSDNYKIAGTADYIGSYNSYKKYLKRKREPKFNNASFVIGDWKTSTQIYDDYWIQLASYVKMFEDLTNIKSDGAFIAQFRNGKIKVEEKTYDELEKYFKIMLNCLEIYKYKKGEI